MHRTINTVTEGCGAVTQWRDKQRTFGLRFRWRSVNRRIGIIRGLKLVTIAFILNTCASCDSGRTILGGAGYPYSTILRYLRSIFKRFRAELCLIWWVVLEKSITCAWKHSNWIVYLANFFAKYLANFFAKYLTLSLSMIAVPLWFTCNHIRKQQGKPVY